MIRLIIFSFLLLVWSCNDAMANTANTYQQVAANNAIKLHKPIQQPIKPKINNIKPIPTLNRPSIKGAVFQQRNYRLAEDKKAGKAKVNN